MGHPVLREKARALDPVEITEPAIQRLIDDMFETMHEYQGIGLAAPQVYASIRLFVAGVDEPEDSIPPVVMINPEITPIGGVVGEDWEGCLSIPDIRGLVSRPDEVRIRALDRHGRELSLTASGFPGAGHPARDGSSRRGAVRRPDDVVGEPDLSRGVRQVLGEGADQRRIVDGASPRTPAGASRGPREPHAAPARRARARLKVIRSVSPSAVFARPPAPPPAAPARPLSDRRTPSPRRWRDGLPAPR